MPPNNFQLNLTYPWEQNVVWRFQEAAMVAILDIWMELLKKF